MLFVLKAFKLTSKLCSYAPLEMEYFKILMGRPLGLPVSDKKKKNQEKRKWLNSVYKWQMNLFLNLFLILNFWNHWNFRSNPDKESWWWFSKDQRLLGFNSCSGSCRKEFWSQCTLQAYLYGDVMASDQQGRQWHHEPWRQSY